MGVCVCVHSILTFNQFSAESPSIYSGRNPIRIAGKLLKGDAENARHELAGHENAAPCCRGGKCET